jgi:hypothetical protein
MRALEENESPFVASVYDRRTQPQAKACGASARILRSAPPAPTGTAPVMNRRYQTLGSIAIRRDSPLRLAMPELGKLLVLLGLALAAVGAVLWKTGGLGGLGKLPGDIFVQRGGTTFSFPIVSCLLLSAVLTLVMWLLRK